MFPRPGGGMAACGSATALGLDSPTALEGRLLRRETLQVVCMAAASDGLLWVGLEAGGVLSFDPMQDMRDSRYWHGQEVSVNIIERIEYPRDAGQGSWQQSAAHAWDLRRSWDWADRTEAWAAADWYCRVELWSGSWQGAEGPDFQGQDLGCDGRDIFSAGRLPLAKPQLKWSTMVLRFLNFATVRSQTNGVAALSPATAVKFADQMSPPSLGPRKSASTSEPHVNQMKTLLGQMHAMAEQLAAAQENLVTSAPLSSQQLFSIQLTDPTRASRGVEAFLDQVSEHLGWGREVRAGSELSDF
ncbi:unnamed protein product [Prorocentrum cordatum]|uniref:Peroxin/Ferlin domain-containing protein n=1 Tax=Prorocentrum cordatum TaxID=2364126 RepID=A0ABN9T0I0_9DINO|nr:unnamed protein product [Polarella glacialis]